MAYIPQDEQNQEQGMNVLGQDQSQANQQGQQDPQQPVQIGGGQSATIQPGGPAPQAFNQANQAPGGQQAAGGQAPQRRAQKPRGSGLFTDLRKYVEANRPAAQRIAGAVTQGVQQEASRIGEQVRQQSAQYQQRVADEAQKQRQAVDFAEQQIQAASQGQQLQDQDVQRFRDLARGTEQYGQIADYVDTPQALEAQQLARRAAIMGTAQGLGRNLEETFGRGEQYTTGQRALDALILGGDRGAREDIVQASQQTTQGLQDQMRDARRAALQAAGEVRRDAEMLGGGLETRVGEEQQLVESDIDRLLQEQRDAITSEQQAFQDALRTGTLTEDQLRRFLDQSDLDAAIRRRQEQLREQARFATDPRAFADDRAGGHGYGDLTTHNAALMFSRGGYTGGLTDPRINSGTLGQRITGQLDAIMNLNPGMNDVRGVRNILENDPGAGGRIYRAARMMSELGASQNEIADIIDQAEASVDKIAMPHEGDSKMARLQRTGAQNQYETNLNQAILSAMGRYMEDRADTLSSQGMIDSFLDAANRQRRTDTGDILAGMDVGTIERADVISPEIIARQQALAQLAGQPGIGIAAPSGRELTPGSVNLFDALRRYGVYR